MPKWYRLNASGAWGQLSKVYRLNASGAWGNLKTIYRLNASGAWGIVHNSEAVPVATTNPTLLNQNSSADNFYGGDTLTLKRGSYTETTTDTNTTYRLRIYKGADATKAITAANISAGFWTVVAEADYTGLNSTANTSITGSVTDLDAKNGMYFVGEVRVNNDANTPGSTSYDFETASRVLSRISFTVSSLSVTPTDRGGTFSWTVGGVADSTYIYSQTLTVRLTGPSGTIIKTESIAPGTTTTVISDSVNFSPSTLYYAVIQVVANDGWKLSGTPNSLSDNEYFNTLSAAPVNTIAPTIGPLNNRGYLPVSTTLTATNGTWSNVSGTTGYSYDWWIEDSITSVTSNTGYISSNTISYTTSDVSDYLFVRVRATNADGGVGTATSPTYILDQKIAVGTISPISANKDVSTNFSFSISHYPTSYVVDWGDGSSNSYSVSANTSTVNATIAHTYTSTGTKTITVTAQPGGVVQNQTITVNAPIDITLNANGGTISSGPGNGLTSYTYSGFSGSTFTAPSATRTHYSLNYWRYPLSGGDPYFLYSGINYTYGSLGLESSRTYYAIWTANTYTVSYNANGGSVGTTSASVQYPGSVTLPTPSRSGYTFNGWYTASSGGSFVGNAGSSYSPTSNITLYAQWTVIQYTVTWNANGGSVSPSSSTVNAGGSVTAPTPTRSGYTFLYWRDTPSGDYLYSVNAGASFTPPSSITMYARWQINQYTVTFNANGGTVSPTSSTVNAGSSVTLPTPSRSGYTFNGWYTASSGGSFVGNAGSSYTPSSSVTIYAQWSAITYTVTWNANGGSVSPSSSSGTSGSTVTAPTPTRSGYTFLYWRDTPSGDYLYQVNAGGTWTISGNITFYARWQLNFTAPTAPAPSLNTQRLSGNSYLRWYCDYPSVSGDVQSITGMNFQINNTADTTTLLANSTRAYPGANVYPYNVGGVNWAFKCGVDGQVSDISYSSATRYARARVQMTGTDGNTYYGTWSGWTALP